MENYNMPPKSDSKRPHTANWTKAGTITPGNEVWVKARVTNKAWF